MREHSRLTRRQSVIGGTKLALKVGQLKGFSALSFCQWRGWLRRETVEWILEGTMRCELQKHSYAASHCSLGFVHAVTSHLSASYTLQCSVDGGRGYKGIHNFTETSKYSVVSAQTEVKERCYRVKVGERNHGHICEWRVQGPHALLLGNQACHAAIHLESRRQSTFHRGIRYVG